MTVRLSDTVAAEWTKLRSVRTTWTVAIAAMVVSVGLSVLFCLVTAQDYANLPAEQRLDFDAAGTSLVGLNLGLVLVAILGVLAVSTEYTTDMMRLTLAITPRRGRVLLSKALVVGLFAFVLGAVFAVAAFSIGQALLGTNPDIHALALGDPGVLRGMFGWGAEMAAFALIAFSGAVITRSSVGSVVLTIALIFAPAIVGAFLPAWVRTDILTYFPASAAEQLSAAHAPDGPGPVIGGTVLLGWVALALVLARTRLIGRDSG
ncbi:ABC transporter permease [Actinokineospora enzanensis]|uniref:ABC transporter permease n=1 Tax=Actinokineospora enzanensis TaxID=155975 RepID=UPI0003625665|nr:ABC transporter permease [Actinokineospora enzanensis]